MKGIHKRIFFQAVRLVLLALFIPFVLSKTFVVRATDYFVTSHDIPISSCTGTNDCQNTFDGNVDTLGEINANGGNIFYTVPANSISLPPDANTIQLCIDLRFADNSSTRFAYDADFSSHITQGVQWNFPDPLHASVCRPISSEFVSTINNTDTSYWIYVWGGSGNDHLAEVAFHYTYDTSDTPPPGLTYAIELPFPNIHNTFGSFTNNTDIYVCDGSTTSVPASAAHDYYMPEIPTIDRNKAVRMKHCIQGTGNISTGINTELHNNYSNMTGEAQCRTVEPEYLQAELDNIYSGNGYGGFYWARDNISTIDCTYIKLSFAEPTPIPEPIAPSIQSISGATITEGAFYSFSGSFTDPDSVSWTATVDYGDGSGVHPLSLSGTTFSLSHQYQDNGSYTVMVVITDNQSLTGTDSAIVAVTNALPSVGTVTVPTAPEPINIIITASAPFTDPGVLDFHTTIWNWGDGSTSAGSVTETTGSGTVAGSHTYAEAGVYTLTLTVTDNDGASSQSTYQYVVVYNPTGGFLTASGKYNTLEGDVKIGTQVKYTSGNTPIGKSRITFKAGNLDFASTSNNWLVVMGAKAYLEGNGTINGSGNYNFLISGIDGSLTGGQNFIRVRITDLSNAIVYDSQPGAPEGADPTTPLTNGSIKIH